MKSAKTLMIQGTSSDVGKSLLSAAFCRIYYRRGIKVYPFKSQNMALNSYVGPDGSEIGRAQALQAFASGLLPEAAMNPVLLKPEADSRSQIVLMGKVRETMKGRDYFSFRNEIWPEITSVMDRIKSENDLIIIEGAGSPAEINLNDREIVNMRVAQYMDAPVLLAADIDRGGVFASIVGTIALLEKKDADRIKGFLINKFRGDVSLLKPGLEMLEEKTEKRPVLGVIPWLEGLNLPQEDSVFLEKTNTLGYRIADGSAVPEGNVVIGVPRFPRISNFDDLDALVLEEGVGIRFADKPQDLRGVSAILLPGSKTTIKDLLWLNETGLAKEIIKLADNGTPVAGICGGYQMLGKIIDDSAGIETSGTIVNGLGLLDTQTVFSRGKTTAQVSANVTAGPGKGHVVKGYEIHMGETGRTGSIKGFARINNKEDGAVSSSGKIWGTYIHGIFDEPGFRRAWLESIGWQKRGKETSLSNIRNEQLDRLADIVEKSVDMTELDKIIGLG